MESTPLIYPKAFVVEQGPPCGLGHPRTQVETMPPIRRCTSSRDSIKMTINPYKANDTAPPTKSMQVDYEEPADEDVEAETRDTL